MVPTRAPHPDVIVTHLEFEVIRSLTAVLDNDDTWRLVAECFNKCYGIFSANDIRAFQSRSSPSEMLLHEIGNRFCTVGVLSEILEHCQLYDALSLLKQPERVVITHQPGDGEDTMYIPEGTSLRLECRAFGLPPPRYVWFLGNEELRDQTSNIVVIRDFSIQDEGEYYCCVSQAIDGNELYQVYSRRVNVELLPVPPTIHEQPVPHVVFREGDVVTLSCIATGHPEPQYEWFKENIKLPGEETSTLTLSGATPSCQGSYRCYVHNKSDAVWSNQSNLVSSLNLRWMLAILTDLCVFILILSKHIPDNTLKQEITCSSDVLPE